MTDENPPGGTSPPKEPEPKNKAVKISMDEAYALLVYAESGNREFEET